MSLSSQFEKSQADFQQATRNASKARLSRTMEKMANGFAGAVQGIAARKAKGKEPNWFQKRKTEKWIWRTKGLASTDITPRFFEDIPGFRKLRDACADPKMDIRLRIYVTGGSDFGIKVDLDPTRPFKDSAIEPSSSLSWKIDFPDPGLTRPGRPGTRPTPPPQSANMPLTVPAAPATPVAAPAVQNSGIVVLPQLRLKMK